MEDNRCVICEADFRASGMVGSKCISCNSLYPNAKTREDIKVTSKNKARTMSDEVVREIIYEILDELGITVKCSCGKKFYKRSPAQKSCGDCPTPGLGLRVEETK